MQISNHRIRWRFDELLYEFSLKCLFGSDSIFRCRVRGCKNRRHERNEAADNGQAEWIREQVLERVLLALRKLLSFQTRFDRSFCRSNLGRSFSRRRRSASTLSVSADVE